MIAVMLLAVSLVGSSIPGASSSSFAEPAGAEGQAPQNGDRRLEGTVADQQGLPIPSARITLTEKQGSVRRSVVSSTDRFQIDGLPAAEYDVRIEAPGFEPQTLTVDLRGESSTALNVKLEIGRLAQQVVVTPTRGEQTLADIPASVTILTSEEIESSPAVIADDVLRQIPSFSLFRRTSAIVAQPTTQGVSLRGIGPSGQSRTLVLLDGVPFNDPFGGWVYWTRVPLASVDRIEVTEDPTSSLYGSSAMGGVINIMTSRPTPQTLELTPQFGSEMSPKLDFFASERRGTWGAAVEGSFYGTDGFPIVAPIERGPIDNHADVNYKNFTAKFEYTPSDRINAFARAGYFTEERNNAKVGELNDTRWTTVNGGVRVRLPDESDLQARVYGDVQRAHFNFLAVTNPGTTRNLVRLSVDQHVPTNGFGWTTQWSKSVGSVNVVSAGADWRWVDGDSQEDGFAAATPQVIDPPPVTIRAVQNLERISGGSQQLFGGYIQDVLSPMANLSVTLSARVDHWRNYDGHNLETTVPAGVPTANHKPSLPDRDDTVVSPRAAALYHFTDRISAWGALTSGFRAPTLTELYRQFMVGAILTRPNDQLGPERLWGGEAGINLAPTRNMTIRTTLFDNRLKNPVSNVTIGVNLQQKLPLARTRVWGVQTEAEYRLAEWRFSGAYIYDDAKVKDGGVATTLTGKYLQQVPKHRGSVQVGYMNPKYANVTLGILAMGLQYNDDLNVQFIPAPTLVEAGYSTSTKAGLPGYAVVDLMVSRELGSNLRLFFGVQNLTDRVYFVQTNPSTTGTPRLMTGGVRIRFSGR